MMLYARELKLIYLDVNMQTGGDPIVKLLSVLKFIVKQEDLTTVFSFIVNVIFKEKQQFYVKTIQLYS